MGCWLPEKEINLGLKYWQNLVTVLLNLNKADYQ